MPAPTRTGGGSVYLAGSPTAVTLTNAVLPGDMLIAAVTKNPNSAVTISDNYNGTWPAALISVGDMEIHILFGSQAAAAGTMVVTATLAGATQLLLTVDDFS